LDIAVDAMILSFLAYPVSSCSASPPSMKLYLIVLSTNLKVLGRAFRFHPVALYNQYLLDKIIADGTFCHLHFALTSVDNVFCNQFIFIRKGKTRILSSVSYLVAHMLIRKQTQMSRAAPEQHPGSMIL
jgi:hypothetical protein